MTQKLKYVPIEFDNDEAHADNTVTYTTIIEQLGWLDAAGVQDREFKPRTLHENEAHRVIDFFRHETHRIYDVPQLTKDHTLLRKSHFPFKTDKNGKKTYEKKTLEVKIEFYGDEKAKGTRNRKRMGFREINLCDYIDKGTVVECLRLDTGEKGSELAYITMKFEISRLDDEKDEILRQEEMTTIFPGKNVSASGLVGDDSSDFETLGSEDLSMDSKFAGFGKSEISKS